VELGLKLFLIEEIEEAQESNGPPEILDLIDFQGITEKNANWDIFTCNDWKFRCQVYVTISNNFVGNSAWWLRHGFRSTTIKGVGPNIMGFRSTYYRVQFKGVKGYVKWAEGSRARDWLWASLSERAKKSIGPWSYRSGVWR